MSFNQYVLLFTCITSTSHCEKCRNIFCSIPRFQSNEQFISTCYICFILQRTAELICSNDDFAILCKAFEKTALDKVMDEKNGTRMWTIFAPTNKALKICRLN